MAFIANIWEKKKCQRVNNHLVTCEEYLQEEQEYSSRHKFVKSFGKFTIFSLIFRIAVMKSSSNAIGRTDVKTKKYR